MTPSAPKRACPVCKRSVAARDGSAAHHPFCSRRCADVDLQRWFAGAYVIPTVEDEREDRGGEAGQETGSPL